jgi:hypothetical protein
MTPAEMERQVALRLRGSGALVPGSVQERMVRQVIGQDGDPPRRRGRRRGGPEREIPIVDQDRHCNGCGDFIGCHPVAESYGRDGEGRSVLVVCGNRLVRSFPMESDKEVEG